MAGSVPALAGLTPTVGDFADHITTTFPEVRLKTFLEMRGADAGRPDMMLAQSALWVGLLYDDAALEAALRLCARHPWRDLTALRAAVPKQGLAAPFAGGTVRDLARDVLAIAADGLNARGLGERVYLAPLDEIAAGGPTQAEHWLTRYAGAWGGNAARIFDEAAI
jgi:glutamate--cysteine ligase